LVDFRTVYDCTRRKPELSPPDARFSRPRAVADDERQGQALLVLVLALLVGVADAAHLGAAQEQDLGDPLPRINFSGQGGGVADLDRDLAAPLRLQGRYVDDDAAVADEDAGLQGEVAGLRNGEAIHVVDAGQRANRSYLVVAESAAAAERLHDLR